MWCPSSRPVPVADMEERYIRNLGALTESECLLLREKKVFVAGCGGLGGHIIDMLLRVGVGSIAAADGDVFEESNLNRQLLSRTDVIGASKAETARAHAAAVNPELRFTAYSEFVTEENASEMLRGCDAVVDALDNIPARRLLKGECDRQGIPYIYGAITGWTAQAAVSLPGDGFIDMIYPVDAGVKSKSSLSFTPALCASLQSALCVKLLCGREVQPGRLYYFDLADFEFETLF